jgi:hypothetical protein
MIVREGAAGRVEAQPASDSANTLMEATMTCDFSMEGALFEIRRTACGDSAPKYNSIYTANF